MLLLFTSLFIFGLIYLGLSYPQLDYNFWGKISHNELFLTMVSFRVTSIFIIGATIGEMTFPVMMSNLLEIDSLYFLFVCRFLTLFVIFCSGAWLALLMCVCRSSNCSNILRKARIAPLFVLSPPMLQVVGVGTRVEICYQVA